MVILSQVESAVLASVTPVTEALTLAIQPSIKTSEEDSNGDDEELALVTSLQERLTSLQQQVRQLSITESRRLYELLQAQRVAIEEEQELELQKIMEAVKEEERMQMQERIAERVERIKERYHSGVERMMVG